MDFKYIDLDQVLAIHFDQIERYKGSHGIRDLDLLISAISRPQASFDGMDLYPDMFSKCASLMHSLVLNHPFIDGNKRTAMVSGFRMLYLNGHTVHVDQKAFYSAAMNIANKKWNIEKISSWLASVQ